MKNNKNIIYHIFRADVYFMTTSMIKNIITTSKFNHFFIIVGINDNNISYFKNLFTEYEYKKYSFIYERSNFKKSTIISYLFKHFLKIPLYSWEIDLLKFLSDLNYPTILIHAECSVMFSLLLLLKSRINKNLVIWGSVLNPNNYSNIYFKLRRKLYKNYLNIVCLMPEDCTKLTDFYNANNGIYIPYISDIFLIINNLPPRRESNINKIQILLGNSGCCIGNYYDDLKTLEIFKGENITIDCMLNYGSSEEDNNKLIKAATSVYDFKFKAHTTLWSKEYVYDFINEFDIYISSRSDQSGLGTMYFAILYGMKLYLSGNNYAYFRNIGIKLFHTDEIEALSFKEFIRPLTDEEKKLNYSLIIRSLDYESVINKWENFYDKIISN